MQYVKESIFVSAIRSFFNAFLAMIGVLIGIVILLAVGMSFSGSSPISMPNDQIAIEMLPDAEGNTSPISDSTPVILQIDVSGIIGLDDSVGEFYETYLRMSQHSNFIKPGRVKGILLNIMSPGGVVSDSDILYSALMRYKEKYKVPIYSYGTLVCASGSYMAACASDKIFTSRTCMVGSVGVKAGPFFNYKGLMEQHGVKAVELTAGLDKVKYPSFTQIPKTGDSDSTESYQDLVDITKQLYDQFTTLVAQARGSHGLTKDALENKYGARVYLGPMAQHLGYVDNGDATYETALTELVKVSGIEENTKYQVLRFKHKRSPLQSLVRSSLKMWSLRANEWITGVKHEGTLDGKLLYHCDLSDRPMG